MLVLLGLVSLGGLCSWGTALMQACVLPSSEDFPKGIPCDTYLLIGWVKDLGQFLNRINQVTAEKLLLTQ